MTTKQRVKDCVKGREQELIIQKLIHDINKYIPLESRYWDNNIYPLTKENIKQN